MSISKSTINTVTSSIRRADQMFAEQVGENTTLDHGIAFWDQDYPSSKEGNAIREVWVEGDQALLDAWNQVEEFYHARQLKCDRWVPSLGQPADVMESFLSQNGFRRQTLSAMYLPDWIEPRQSDQVRVLPARAMRTVFRSLHQSEDIARAEERRLDDAQFDVFVATISGRPAGMCGMQQVGEIACIRNLYIVEDYRRRQVASSLLAHALGLARRLMMKIVCFKIEAENTAGIKFFESCGFTRQGEIVEFQRPG